MQQVQKITDDFAQIQTVVLPDGTSFTFTIHFSPLQTGWFIDSLVYGSFTLDGIRICNSPSMLRQWRNVTPFGLACFSDVNREPSLQQDFSSGASKLYVLSHAEVLEYEAFLSER